MALASLGRLRGVSRVLAGDSAIDDRFCASLRTMGQLHLIFFCKEP